MFLKTAKQVFQLFSANLLKAIFGFAGSILVLRGWSTGDIGDIYTLVGVLMILNQIGDLGSGTSYIKLANASKENEKELTQAYLSYKLYIGLIYFSIALFFYWYYYFIDTSREYFGLATVLVTSVAHTYSSFFSIYINSNRRFNELTILKVFPPLLKTFLIVGLWLLGLDHFAWLLFAFIVPSFASLFMGRFLTKISIIEFSRFRYIFTPMGKKLYDMSRWVFILGFFQTSFSQVDILMLKRLSTDIQVGQFVGAHKLAAIFLMLSQSVFTVLLPKMHHLRMKSELLNLNKNLFLFYFIFILGAVPVTFLAPWMVKVFLGPKYMEAIPILKVFVFQAVGHMFIMSQMLLFYRLDKIKALVLISAAQLFANFAGNFMVIAQYKAFGVVWVSMLLYNLTFLLMSVYIYFSVRYNKRGNLIEVGLA